MATIQDILESAMGKIGAMGPGDPFGGDELALCLKRFNTLVDSLNGDDFFAYSTIETVVSLATGVASKTIGPSMTIDIARPMKLLPQCYVRLDSIDYSLEPLDEAQFNSIRLKSLQAFVPRFCHYDGNVPTGTVYFYPLAGQTCSVHLFTPERLSENSDITTALVLPPGYRLYLENELAVEIWSDFYPGKAVPPIRTAMAMNAKRDIRKANYTVPQLMLERMPTGRLTPAYIVAGDGI